MPWVIVNAFEMYLGTVGTYSYAAKLFSLMYLLKIDNNKHSVVIIKGCVLMANRYVLSNELI